MEQKAPIVPRVSASPPGLGSCQEDSSSVSMPVHAALPCEFCKRANKNPCLVTSLARAFQAQSPKSSLVPSGQDFGRCGHNSSREGEPRAEPFVGQLPPPLPVTISSVWAGTRISRESARVHTHTPGVGHFSHSSKGPILGWPPPRLRSRALQNAQDSHCLFPLQK